MTAELVWVIVAKKCPHASEQFSFFTHFVFSRLMLSKKTSARNCVPCNITNNSNLPFTLGSVLQHIDALTCVLI